MACPAVRYFHGAAQVSHFGKFFMQLIEMFTEIYSKFIIYSMFNTINVAEIYMIAEIYLLLGPI